MPFPGFSREPPEASEGPTWTSSGPVEAESRHGAEELGPAAQGTSQFPTVIKAAVGFHLRIINWFHTTVKVVLTLY